MFLPKADTTTENTSEPVFFAAYVGPSMNPTLREPEIMEIMPYNKRPMRVGDVAFFLPPESNQPVVHRIIRITPEGISTLGDNNSRKDTFLLQRNDIKGLVVAAWRGQKRRNIVGGLCGRMTSGWLRCRRVLDRCVSPLLHPLYYALSGWKLIALVLPAQFQPRVVVFRTQNREQFQLLMGRRVIGLYDDKRQKWQIHRPFQLFVDRKLLPKQKEKNQLKQKFLNGRKLNMNYPLTRKVLHNLVLADGTRWEIGVWDEEAAAIVSQLGCAMRLPANTGVTESSNKIPPQQGNGNLRRLLVRVDAHTSATDCWVPLASQREGVVSCILSPRENWGGPYATLVKLSLVFAREAQARGGVLIHGALAERDGMGVILAAPSGMGKTTASNRLPLPWRSLCDDTTLVVRDAQGNCWGHPWPTWSRFQNNGPGGSWDVQNAVPLKGIFILARAEEDRVEQIGTGHAVSMLVECVRQVSISMGLGLRKNERHALNLKRFDNLCALTRVMPAHVLHISLTGTFWREIEQALCSSDGRKITNLE